MQKRQQIKVITARDNEEFSELAKLITKTWLRDIRNCNVNEPEAAVNKGSTAKTSASGGGDDDADNDVGGACAHSGMVQSLSCRDVLSKCTIKS